MKFCSLILLAGLSAVALAQSTAQLPSCANSCIGTSVMVPGCNSADVKCICQNSGYISNLACCVKTKCSGADVQATLNFALQLCSASGVNLDPNQGCSSSASGTSSATGSTSSTGSTTSSTSSATQAAQGSPSPAGSTSASTSASKGGAEHIVGNGMVAGAAAALLAFI